MTIADETRRAFLAAILARSDDDMPRLIYADWLDEHAGYTKAPCDKCSDGFRRHASQYHSLHVTGLCRRCKGTRTIGAPDGQAERAEFIRVQCALAAHEANEPTGRDRQEVDARWLDWSQKRTALRLRESDLLRLHEGEWLPPPVFDAACWGIVPDFTEHRRWRWARGFVAEVTTSWNLWLKHHPAILAACPIRGPNVGTREEPRYEQPAKDGLIRLATLPPAGDWATSTPYLTWLESEFPGVPFRLPDDVLRGIVTRPQPVVSRRFRQV